MQPTDGVKQCSWDQSIAKRHATNIPQRAAARKPSFFEPSACTSPASKPQEAFHPYIFSVDSTTSTGCATPSESEILHEVTILRSCWATLPVYHVRTDSAQLDNLTVEELLNWMDGQRPESFNRVTLHLLSKNVLTEDIQEAKALLQADAQMDNIVPRENRFSSWRRCWGQCFQKARQWASTAS